MEAFTLITVRDLKDIVFNAVSMALSEHQHTTHPTTSAPEPFIKGIHELAKFLHVSPARAQKLKNEGVFPYWQDGRTLLFDPAKVREAMTNIKKRRA